VEGVGFGNFAFAEGAREVPELVSLPGDGLELLAVSEREIGIGAQVAGGPLVDAPTEQNEDKWQKTHVTSANNIAQKWCFVNENW